MDEGFADQPFTADFAPKIKERLLAGDENVFTRAEREPALRTYRLASDAEPASREPRASFRAPGISKKAATITDGALVGSIDVVASGLVWLGRKIIMKPIELAASGKPWSAVMYVGAEVTALVATGLLLGVPAAITFAQLAVGTVVASAAGHFWNRSLRGKYDQLYLPEPERVRNLRELKERRTPPKQKNPWFRRKSKEPKQLDLFRDV